MKTAETVINERQYKILLPPVTERMLLANRLAAQLGKAIGAIGQKTYDELAKFLQSERDGKTIAQLITDNPMTISGIISGAGGMLSALDPEKMLALMTNAAARSHLACAGKSAGTEIDFERHFNEYPEDVYHACLWCLWECTRDFLPRSLKDSGQGVQQTFVEEFKSRMAGK
jgi:hypothetical protein